jgi:hypothetical protein
MLNWTSRAAVLFAGLLTVESVAIAEMPDAPKPTQANVA